MRVLVVNAGSSSLKLRVLDSSDKVTGTADLPAPRGAADAAAMESALASLGDADAVGYRIVHGGTSFTAPVRIDDDVLAKLRALTDLAPLHQPRALAGIAAVRAAMPGVPAVACFDTAFHAGLPAAAAAYALPAAWTRRFGLRRFGFHGLSHAYAAGRAAELTGRGRPPGPAGPQGHLGVPGGRSPGPARPRPGDGGTGPQGHRGVPGGRSPGPARHRVVTCHLGAGSSLAAVLDGRCVDTTMGFTPLEGLVMATRSGSVDPGLVVWLLRHGGLSTGEVSDGLEFSAGLAGLADLPGGSGDMRDVRSAADRGNPDARLALDVHAHRLRAGIAAMAAALGGLDTLVFTGGIGEHQGEVRAEAGRDLSAPDYQELIADLLAGSPDFAAIWVRQDVRGRREGLKRFQHPELGRFDLEYTSFQVAEQPSLRLYLYTPADDGRSETKLREAVTARPGPSSGA